MNALIRHRPLGEVSNNMRNEMDQLIHRFFGGPVASEGSLFGGASFFPVTNVVETDADIVVTCEVPGLDPKDIDISVADGVLTIRGEKRQEVDEKRKQTLHRVERTYGSFTRTFALPANVVMDKVAADYKNGVLRITMPKTEEARPREVKIKVS